MQAMSWVGIGLFTGGESANAGKRPSLGETPMNILAILLVAATVAVTGCSPPDIEGDGTLTTERRAIEDFAALDVDGACQVKWSSGSPSLTVSADRNLLPRVTTTVSGTTLRIASAGKLLPSGVILITVSSNSLSEVRVNGAVGLTAGGISGPALKLDAGGTSFIGLDGAVTTLDAGLSGTSNLDATGLAVRSARVTLKGSANAVVKVADALKASVADASVLTYSGSPNALEQNVSGLAKIQGGPQADR